jgi:hypothetical protein
MNKATNRKNKGTNERRENSTEIKEENEPKNEITDRHTDF